MRQLALSLFAAVALLAATSGTALMAIVGPITTCGADDGNVHIDYTYDDATNIIQTLSVTNENPTRGTVVAQIFNASGTLVRSVTLAINGGRTRSDDISALDLQMVSRTGNHGTSLQLPGSISCTWLPGR